MRALLAPVILAAAFALCSTAAQAHSALPPPLSLSTADGAARWVELPADHAARRLSAWVWPAAFVLAGTVLLLYREA
jgi:hypothetical protein